MKGGVEDQRIHDQVDRGLDQLHPAPRLRVRLALLPRERVRRWLLAAGLVGTGALLLWMFSVAAGS